MRDIGLSTIYTKRAFKAKFIKCDGFSIRFVDDIGAILLLLRKHFLRSVAMNKYGKILMEPFRTLKTKRLPNSFCPQTVSLSGDAFTWLALALLSYELSPARSAAILASALTLRVTAYIIFSPFAGVVSERFKRKSILWMTQGFRVIILCLIPFVSVEWQLYVLIFLLNVAAAFFTPTYRAIIPQIVPGNEYREANGFSMATFQLLSVFGPALAGLFAVWLGLNNCFWSADFCLRWELL